MQSTGVSYPILHGFLNQCEALPARVKLMLVCAFKHQQVTDDLQNTTQGTNTVMLGLTPSEVEECLI